MITSFRFLFFRQSIFTLLFFCATLNSTGQPSFEGKIKYDVILPGETKPANLILLFGPNKIKMELIVPGKTSDNDYNIIDLDSGKVYTMDVRDKSYSVKSLHKRKDLSVLLSKEIAGYRTTLFTHQHPQMQSDEDFLPLLNNALFYTADDLYYFIPKVYEDNSELMMIKNNKVVLGIEAAFSNKQWNLNNTAEWGFKNGFVASAMATVITALKLNPALFTVPAGYLEK